MDSFGIRSYDRLLTSSARNSMYSVVCHGWSINITSCMDHSRCNEADSLSASLILPFLRMSKTFLKLLTSLLIRGIQMAEMSRLMLAVKIGYACHLSRFPAFHVAAYNVNKQYPTNTQHRRTHQSRPQIREVILSHTRQLLRKRERSNLLKLQS
jgi:hypothetical protein